MVSAPAGCLGDGQLPSTAGLTRTDRAVIPPPLVEAVWRPGCTLMQLPAVTSVSWAGVSSDTSVDGVKSTVAVPDRWLTWIVLPDTESISPRTQSLPLADADGDDEVGGELVGFADVGFALFDAPPQAATDSAAAPVTARIAERDSRAVRKVAGIEVLSIVGRGEHTDSGHRPSRLLAPLSAGWCPSKSGLCIPAVVRVVETPPADIRL